MQIDCMNCVTNKETHEVSYNAAHIAGSPDGSFESHCDHPEFHSVEYHFLQS